MPFYIVVKKYKNKTSEAVAFCIKHGNNALETGEIELGWEVGVWLSQDGFFIF